jgi:hypothetical protein
MSAFQLPRIGASLIVALMGEQMTPKASNVDNPEQAQHSSETAPTPYDQNLQNRT